MKTFFKLLPSLIIPIALVFAVIVMYIPKDEGYVEVSKITPKIIKKNVDHSEFEILQKEFATPQEMTEACLSCHNKRGEEFMQTHHWTWTSADTLENGKVEHLGKKNVVNNFCVGINSNEKLCSTCHAGYGWGDKHFDFKNQNNIDCIICHDNTGTYKKHKGKAGVVSPNVDLNKVAQNVGPTTKKNCLNCHGKGGGGNNVKHGDLELVLADEELCTKDVDVHLAKDGANLTCSQCHTSENHNIKGAGPLTNPNDLKDSEGRVNCTDCHTHKPHKSEQLNQHYEKVACETCHIPTYAKVNQTKVYWDWSTATKLKDGKPYDEWNEDKTEEYSSKHGTSHFGSNLVPEYFWWNGISDKTTLETKIDPADTVQINRLHGNYMDKNSKIYPFKVMRAKQPYDTKNNTIVQFHTFGPKGSGALWSDFDWGKSIEAGMDYAGQPYSGHFDFVYSESYWPINHMVSQSKDALTCVECHSSNGRLEGLEGFYLPGRDVNTLLDWTGKLFILFSVLGVIVHASMRMIAKKKNYK